MASESLRNDGAGEVVTGSAAWLASMQPVAPPTDPQIIDPAEADTVQSPLDTPTDTQSWIPEDGEEPERSQPGVLRLSLGDRMRAVPPTTWAFVSIFLLGAVLRFWGLADKPLHHDESLHAYFSWQFMLNPSGYLYDPLLHGPFQFHIIPIFFTLGRILGLSLNGANDFTVRILPALMGTAMVAMPYWLQRQLGRWGALSMAFLLAVSPTFVYYSRFVRDDIYVTSFTLFVAVAAIQYSQTRHIGWLIGVVAAITLSYTAMENTFFTIGVFGSFLIALALWDLGPMLGERLGNLFAARDRALAGRTLVLIPFFAVMGVFGLLGLRWLSQESKIINTLAAQHTGSTDPLNPDVAVVKYQMDAVNILLIVSIIISILVIVGLIRQLVLNTTDTEVTRTGLQRDINPRTQPVLDTLVSTHWVRWFICFVVAWVIFAAFFWQLPANPTSLTEWGQGFQNGIGRGLVRGIYYWLEQQQVARGGQPWYYYFILIPLYEPLILVFGIAGFIRALLQPTRFRLFLVWWFLAFLVLYSWAGEKMPWLVIHIVLPLIGLAAIAFEWIISTIVQGARSWWRPTRILVAAGAGLILAAFAALSVAQSVAVMLLLAVAAIVTIGVAVGLELWLRYRAVQTATQLGVSRLEPVPAWFVGMRQVVAVGSLVVALLLLIPTLWNMQRVTYYEPSVAPNEMLIYVQTTTDVQLVMDKINTLDQQLYHGTHQLHIGLTGAAVWPFAWYLKDFHNTIYNYTAQAGANQPEVIVADDQGGSTQVDTTLPTQFVPHHYRLRWWWDESYKLPQCSVAKKTDCTPQETWGTGVGPFLWLSYGAFPPAPCTDITQGKCDPVNATFNAGKAANRYWSWLWLRHNISGTQPGSTDFYFYVRTDLTHIEKP